MLSAASKGIFPRISLIQGTFSRSFRVLKHKPITLQRPPGPNGDECCTWPFFLLPYPWHPHVAQGDRDEPASLSAPRHLRSCHQGPSLSHVPQFPFCMCHQGSQTVISWLLVGNRGVRGGPGDECVPVAVFFLCPCQSGAVFLIRNVRWWEPLSCPPRQWRGNRGPFILIYSLYVLTWPALC